MKSKVKSKSILSETRRLTYTMTESEARDFHRLCDEQRMKNNEVISRLIYMYNTGSVKFNGRAIIQEKE